MPSACEDFYRTETFQPPGSLSKPTAIREQVCAMAYYERELVRLGIYVDYLSTHLAPAIPFPSPGRMARQRAFTKELTEG